MPEPHQHPHVSFVPSTKVDDAFPMSANDDVSTVSIAAAAQVALPQWYCSFCIASDYEIQLLVTN